MGYDDDRNGYWEDIYNKKDSWTSQSDTSVDNRIDHEEMNALLSATYSSKSDYEDDVDTLKSNAVIASSSPIIENFAEYMKSFLDGFDDVGEYDRVITRIKNEM